MIEKIYCIWLQQALNYGNYKVKFIRQRYKKIEDFYNEREYGWRLCGCFTNNEIDALKTTSLGEGFKIFEECRRLGYRVITISDNDYPKLLWQISNPPAVIYVDGDVSCLNAPLALGVVGTRDATYYGMGMAKEMGYKIALAGATVVSGGALGIDTAAHEGALKAKGNTVAVMGCGFGYEYLPKNRPLREDIAESGALVSEYPPKYPVYKHNFPVRNRIISGLSRGIIVVEAGRKSGSLITANLANEQNRDVFVVPVNMSSSLSTGITQLVNDGAKAIADINDVLEEYRLNLGISLKTPKRFSNSDKCLKRRISGLSENAKIIYDLLGSNCEMHPNDMCYSANFHITTVLEIIWELKRAKLIEEVPGRRFKRIVY